MSPQAFTCSLNLFLKLGTALLIGPAENCSISSPVRLSIQKLLLASDEAFKKPLCVATQTRYLQEGFRFGEFGGHFYRRRLRSTAPPRFAAPESAQDWFLVNHLRTFRVQALLSDHGHYWVSLLSDSTCNVHRPMRLAEFTAPSDSNRLQTSLKFRSRN